MGVLGGCGSPPKHTENIGRDQEPLSAPCCLFPALLQSVGSVYFVDSGCGPTFSTGSLGLAGQRTWGAVLGQSCFFVQDFTYH